MYNIPLFSILDEEAKKRTAFREYRTLTIGQFINRIDDMMTRGANINRPLMDVYDTCKYYVNSGSPEVAIPKVERPTVIDNKPMVLSLPNCDNSLPIIEKLAYAIETAIRCLKEDGLSSIKNKAKKLELYFLQGATLSEIKERQDLKSVEAVRTQIQNGFITPVMSGNISDKGVPRFKFSSDFINELKNVASEALFSSPDLMARAIGYTGIIQDSVYMPFFGVDVLKMDEIPFTCIVPKNEIGNYRIALKAVKDTLYNSFLAIPEQILFDKIKENTPNKVSEEQLKKLLDNFISALGTTESFQDGKIWVKNEYLKVKYLRQARIIYNEGVALSKESIEKIYRELYHESMGVMMSTPLANLGFVCKGSKWVYGNTISDIKDVIRECVEAHNYLVTMDDVKLAVTKSGLQYPEQTLRTYITNICVPCNTERNLFCHKEHIADYPEYSWRKEANYGQENFIIREIINRLSAKGIEDIASLKSCLIALVHSKNYNINSIDSTIQKYSSPKYGLLTIEDGERISLNKAKAESVDLKTIGYKGTSKQYVMAVISLAINELHKQEKNEMWLTDLVPLVLSSIASEPTLTRKKILDILEGGWSNDLTVFRKNERIGIRLNKDLVAAPNYTVEAGKNDNDDTPQMVEIQEEREKISAIVEIDWDKMVARMKRELEFYVRPSWFGLDFDLDEALSDFKSIMTSSQNKNLTTIIPHDLYAYWFCATDEYDRNRYFCDLARCYEALLREIYYSVSTEPMKKANGLYEIAMLYFPKIYEVLSAPDSPYGIGKILKDLSHKRNELAHGRYVELSSVLEAQTITNYVALYVYTIATKGKITK